MNISKFILTALLILGISCNDVKSDQQKELKTKEDSLAYAIGTQMGMNLKNDSLYVDLDILTMAIEDQFNDESKLTDEQLQSIFTTLQTELQERRQRKQLAEAQTNLDKAEAFLADNKKKENIKTTESGLQYEVLKEGNGKQPKKTDKVKVHYTGTLLDGTVFDSSVQRGKPAEFQLNQVIPGWTEGVQLMKVGAKYKFYIHPDMAYGARGSQGAIGPNELLIFEVELLEVK